MPRHTPGGTNVRVLLISHTCRSRAMGQPKARYLGQQPGVQLRVLVPERWQSDDGSWSDVDEPGDAAFELEVGKVRWPYVGPFKRYLHHYPNLAATLREFQPDVIDIWEEPWGLVSAHACWLRRRIVPNAKVISETEQNINKKLPLPFERFRAYTLKQADYVVARSGEALEVSRQKGFSGPARVVPNAVDAELFVPMDRAACRTDLGLSGFIVGYVGRMVPEKGLEDLIEAIAICRDRGGSSVKALFVGSGPLLATLVAQVERLGVKDKVQFLPNRPLHELPKLFNAMDVMALPSRTTAAWKEQFGRVIIEAHACAVPVIGSNSGAIPEVVGQGGLTFPESNPAAIADVILTLAADPARCAQMGRLGREAVEAHYTWQRVAARMYEIYSELAPQGFAHKGIAR
ncbi:MAG: glycosyltransferase family 4 protein [Burkholderiales bacterium]|nr:glycosyltransferase family 4 protein [Phycisphaerae bacterium]